MAKVTVNSGICGFTTSITANSEDMQHAALRFETACPVASGMIKAVEVACGLASRRTRASILRATDKPGPKGDGAGKWSTRTSADSTAAPRGCARRNDSR